jgi:hypothetical protein
MTTRKWGILGSYLCRIVTNFLCLIAPASHDAIGELHLNNRQGTWNQQATGMRRNNATW